jgi:membrane protein DedA with SNARE-associated domain/membrane-associated phospholipid phosphatase
VKPVWLVAAAALAAFLVWRRHKLEPTLLIGGAIAVVGMAVYGTGVVELPNLEESLISIGETLGAWTYLLVGALAFAETGAFVGLIAPGETAMLLGGLVAGQGQIDVITLITIVWACAVAGDMTSFMLGRRLGRTFLVRHGAKVQITEERLETVERFFDRHGGKAILLGRFVGLVRAIAPFLAGSSGMSLRRFVPYDVIGAGLWGSTFVILGYVFWQSFSTLVEYAKKGALDLVQRLDAQPFVDIARVVTELGSLPVAIVLVVGTSVLLLWRREVAEAVVLGAGLVITYAGVHLIKAALDRPRPPRSLIETDLSAYPSAHAAYAVTWIAVAVAIHRGLPNLASRFALVLVGVVVAAAVGLTRIYLRASWLSDVTGGWAIAAAAFALCGLVALVVGYVRDNARDAPRRAAPETT